MNIKRRHWFEFNDTKSIPKFLRDSILEILGKTVVNGKIYDNAIPAFKAFCEQSQCRSILDLCSGSGEATSILLDAAIENGHSELQFFCSDLSPIKHALSSLAIRHPKQANIVSTPIDATSVSNAPKHEARTIVAAFHHFKPEEAKKVLLSAVADKKSIFILEPFPRKLKTTLPFFIYSFIPGALNPFFTKKDRLLKALFTYLIPLIPLLGWWDTLVSALRMYSEEDYMEMVSESKDYEWKYEKLTNPLQGEITIFTGIPK